MQDLEVIREKIQSHYRVVKTDEDLEWNRAIDLCTNIINAHMKCMNNNWIPVSERLPENDDNILLSFENFPTPEIGRYEQDEEGGAFYPGDKEYTYLSYGVFVNAWKPLPKPYKKERDYE